MSAPSSSTSSKHPAERQHFELKLVRHHPDGDQEWTELIRLVDETSERVIVLANGQELVRCRTADGRKLDLLFGSIPDREFDRVVAFVECHEP